MSAALPVQPGFVSAHDSLERCAPLLRDITARLGRTYRVMGRSGPLLHQLTHKRKFWPFHSKEGSMIVSGGCCTISILKAVLAQSACNRSRIQVLKCHNIQRQTGSVPLLKRVNNDPGAELRHFQTDISSVRSKFEQETDPGLRQYIGIFLHAQLPE